MDAIESSSVPPGFRFHPTDEELVGYYLKKKVASERIDLDVIRDIDLYRIEPWDLQERCRIGYEQQNEWYFFSHKDKKYPTGTRTNRATMAGFWKATGRDKAVHDKSRLIGMRKTLVFYKGRAPNGQKTDWIMHEYRLETDENGPPQEEGWVVCRAFKKRTPNCQMTTMESWDPSYNICYDIGSSGSGLTSFFLDSDDYHHVPAVLPLPPPPPPPPPLPSFVCKQETELDQLCFVRANQFIQLPQLESPSLPQIKNNSSEEEAKTILGCTDQKVTDWRALDKFVASQLSSEERLEGESLPEFNTNADEDQEMAALLLFQSSGEGEKSKIDPEDEIGIWIFE